MKPVIKILVILAAVFYIVPSYAADYEIAVCSLQSHSDKHDAYLQPCGTWTSKNSCSSDGWLTWKLNSYQGQAMYSTAMTALVSNTKVKVRLNGSSCNRYDITTMVRITKDS